MAERYTPKTVATAFEKSPKTLAKDCGVIGNINDSSICTRIIQETGRFCERYASDAFLSWESMKKLYTGRENITGPETYYEAFAIRRDGVDGNTFLIPRLKETISRPWPYVHPETVYRKILCVKISITPQENGIPLPPDVVLELRDLTDSFTGIDPEDR